MGFCKLKGGYIPYQMGFRFLKRKWIKHIAIAGKNPIFGKSGLPGKIFPGINC